MKIQTHFVMEIDVDSFGDLIFLSGNLNVYPTCSGCNRFPHRSHFEGTGDGANVILNRIRTSKLTAPRSCAAAAASIKGLRLAGTERRARAARHYMVISCGNLPSELYHGRARQTMPVCPLGTKYHHPERGRTDGEEERKGERAVARVAVGLDGGDITKMSENVTHLIIYAPRSQRYPPSILSFSLSHSSLSHSLPLSLTLPLVHQSSFQQSLSSVLTSPPGCPCVEANPPAAVSPPHSREKLI